MSIDSTIDYYTRIKYSSLNLQLNNNLMERAEKWRNLKSSWERNFLIVYQKN